MVVFLQFYTNQVDALSLDAPGTSMGSVFDSKLRLQEVCRNSPLKTCGLPKQLLFSTDLISFSYSNCIYTYTSTLPILLLDPFCTQTYSF